MSATRWQINRPSVTSEQFDDEIVVVNFDSGKYHSIQGDGVLVWAWLEGLPTTDDVVAHAGGRFEGDAAEIERAVRRFMDELAAEQIIVAAREGTIRAETPTGPDGRRPFRTPVLTTFSDMQELLWLDPIHEVDAAGWPVAKNGAGH